MYQQRMSLFFRGGRAALTYRTRRDTPLIIDIASCLLHPLPYYACIPAPKSVSSLMRFPTYAMQCRTRMNPRVPYAEARCAHCVVIFVPSLVRPWWIPPCSYSSSGRPLHLCSFGVPRAVTRLFVPLGFHAMAAVNKYPVHTARTPKFPRYQQPLRHPDRHMLSSSGEMTCPAD